MATYTPKAIVPVTQLTNAAGTSVYTQPAATTTILRTIEASANAGGHSFTLSIGADGSTTRIFTTYALTSLVPAIFNGWWVIPSGAGGAHALDANADANSVVNLSVGGYEYA